MSQIIIHTFSKAEVESLDFSRFDQIFADWPNQRNGLLRNKMNCLVWQVDGYNENPNELYHISEVRSFYRELHRRWPWWLYFLNVSTEGMAIPYFCLLDSIEASRIDGRSQTRAMFNPIPLLEIFREDFTRMNHLFERAAISDEENDRRTDAIIEHFCGTLI